jgi:LysR family transcriptional regulator, cell division regulator
VQLHAAGAASRAAASERDMTAMDAADLRVFEAVARLGGMGRAAEELHTVQSNVTARIRQLEDQLGTKLFRRHARGVEPTPAGQRLLPYARRMARLLEDARRAALDDGTPQGALVIGSLETTAALRLPEPLAAFAAAHSQVDLTLRTGTTCELLDQVLDRRLEGAFVCGPVTHSDLETEVVFREELALLTAPQVTSLDAMAGRGEVRIVVLRRGCSYRQRLEEVLARRGIPAPRVLEFGTVEAVFGCVAAGLGVTLLPRALVGPVWREGKVALHALPPGDSLVETVFVRRCDGYFSSALAAFLAAVRSVPAVAAVLRTAAE